MAFDRLEFELTQVVVVDITVVQEIGAIVRVEVLEGGIYIRVRDVRVWVVLVLDCQVLLDFA